MKNIFKKVVLGFSLALAAVAFAKAQTVDPANPYAFEKKAYKPDGTPWVGPVNVGDIIKYVLSYKPGAAPSGPVTIDDTLSPNLSYVAPTVGPGWTWSASPYSVGNHEQYKHPGFGPGSGTVLVTAGPSSKPVTGTGDGTIPIPILSLNKVFSIFHHAQSATEGKIDCWDIASLSKCGLAQPNATTDYLRTPRTPMAVIRGTRIFFPGFRSDKKATFGCFDGATNSACSDTPVGATVPQLGAVGGLVEDGAGRIFMTVLDKVFCMTESSGALTPCSGWPVAGLQSVTSALSPNYGFENEVYMLAEFSSNPSKIYIHHSNAIIQCIDTNTASICSTWPATGVQIVGKSNGLMLSSIPSGQTGDGGVCLWPATGGAPIGCVDNNGHEVPISLPTYGGGFTLATLRIPGTNKLFFGNTPVPKCWEFVGTNATACTGITAVLPPVPAGQYGFAMDPSKPDTCVLALGDANIMWRFDYVTGVINCGTQMGKTPPIESLYCNAKPDPSKFKWTGFTVPTAAASGTVTITQGSTTVYGGAVVTNGNYVFTTTPNGATPLTISFVPAGSSPTNIDIVLSYDSDVNPEICYQAKVEKCGPVFNDAVFKGSYNGGAVNAPKRVELGNAVGPDCPKPPPPPPPPAPSCLDGKAEVTCGKVLGTYNIIIKPNGLGGVIPTSVTITPITPGITLFPAQMNYPVVGGQVQVTVVGAHAGDVLEFEVNGTTAGGGSAAGSDLCCNGKIKIEIPKDLPCKDLIPVDLAIKKTGGTTPAPDVPAYAFHLTVTNEGAAYTAAPGTLTVTDVVPAGMVFNSVTGTGWTCVPSTNVPAGVTVTCHNTAAMNLAAGPAAPVGVIDVTATALGNAPFPDFKNCGKVGLDSASGAADSVPQNNRSCVTVSKNPKKSDLKIEKTGLKDCVANTPCPFTITITSVGQPYNGNVLIADVLTPNNAWPITSVVPNVCGSALTNMPFACVANLNLAADTPYVITVTVNPVTVQALEQNENCVTAALVGSNVPVGPISPADVQALGTSGQLGDPVQSCWQFTEHPVTTGGGGDKPDISLVKSWMQGETSFGGKFTLKVKNEAATAITSPQVLKIVDEVPAGMTITNVDASVGTNWTCMPATVTGPATLTCTYGGVLPVAAGSILPDLVLNATLAAPAPGSTDAVTYSNCATGNVHADAITQAPLEDANSANNKDCASVIPGLLHVDGPPSFSAACGTNVIFVVDVSGSITAAGQSIFVQLALNKALSEFNNVNAAGVQSQAAIITFSNTATVVSPMSASTFSTSPSLGFGLTFGGETNWEAAMAAAATMVASAPSPTVIVFITDGIPNKYLNASGGVVSTSDSILATNEAIPFVNAIYGSGVPIIGFGIGGINTYLDALLNTTTVPSSFGDLMGDLGSFGQKMCPDLRLTKSMYPGSTNFYNDPGPHSVAITLTAASTAGALTNVKVKDVLPAELITPTSADPNVAIAGSTITWTLPALGANATASTTINAVIAPPPLDCNAKEIKNTAQVISTDQAVHSLPNNMPTTGPHENDEAKASTQVEDCKPIVQTGTPYLSVSKTSMESCYPVGQQATIAGTPPCAFTVTVSAVNGPFTGNVNFGDAVFSDPGLASVSSALSSVVITGTAGVVPAPASLCAANFTALPAACTETGVTIPAGGSITIKYNLTAPPVLPPGSYKNCFKAAQDNVGAQAWTDYNSVTPGIYTQFAWGFCNSFGIPGTTVKLVKPKLSCDLLTTKLLGDTCRCIIQGQTPISQTACGCPKGTEFKNGQCVKPQPKCQQSTRFNDARNRCEPICKNGQEYNASRNVCLTPKPVCRQGSRYNPATNSCVIDKPVCKRGQKYDAATNRCISVRPVCEPGTQYNPKRNTCVPVEQRCPAGTVKVRGLCVEIPRCRFPQIPVPGTGICVNPFGGGGKPPPRTDGGAVPGL